MPSIPLRHRIADWSKETRLFWRESASVADFLRIMRARLSLSKVGKLVCPNPTIVRARVPKLGGEIWLRSHSTDIGVLAEQLASQTYECLEGHRDVRTIFDLGANTGLVARWLLATYPDARVVCVEPEPGNVAMLRRNLSGFNGRAVIVPECVGASERTTRLATDSGAWGYAMTDEDGDVPVTTMGRLIDEHGIDRIDLLKCDIEGAERELFEACSGWIGRVGFAVVECHDLPAEDILPDGWAITERHGWAAMGIETVALARVAPQPARR